MPRTPNTNLLKSKLVELLYSEAPLTRKQLGLSPYYIDKLLGANHVAKLENAVKVVNAETGKPDRGHPAHAYKLTPNGRKVAKRFVARNAQAEGETATA